MSAALARTLAPAVLLAGAMVSAYAAPSRPGLLWLAIFLGFSSWGVWAVLDERLARERDYYEADAAWNHGEAWRAHMDAAEAARAGGGAARVALAGAQAREDELRWVAADCARRVRPSTAAKRANYYRAHGSTIAAEVFDQAAQGGA